MTAQNAGQTPIEREQWLNLDLARFYGTYWAAFDDCDYADVQQPLQTSRDEFCQLVNQIVIEEKSTVTNADPYVMIQIVR